MVVMMVECESIWEEYSRVGIKRRKERSRVGVQLNVVVVGRRSKTSV